MQTKVLNFLFLVQGEGRGHMTQAITLYQALIKARHRVSCVMVGKSDRREIPAFFYEKIQSEIHTYESPNFVLDEKSKAIRLFPTILQNLKKAGYFFNNLKFIHSKVVEHRPDVIVNFYDLLGGLYSMRYKPACKFICIGHQYLMEHQAFPFPRKKALDRFLVSMNTRVTAARAHKKLALSFRPMPHEERKKLKVVPPLLRQEVLDQKSGTGAFLLVYVVNSGYGEDIEHWHKSNRHIEVHCFWDKKGALEEYKPHPNLTFHKINDKKFLEYMRNCQGYVSTAGFESICEAMYLGKPVMMVPIHGHYEQLCNATDALQSKVGISDTTFNMERFLQYLPNHVPITEDFNQWVNQAENVFIKELTENYA